MTPFMRWIHDNLPDGFTFDLSPCWEQCRVTWGDGQHSYIEVCNRVLFNHHGLSHIVMEKRWNRFRTAVDFAERIESKRLEFNDNARMD